MTTTYDPRDPVYLDEADVRDELTRVYDICQGCRRCTSLCTSFPTLFEMLDGFDDRDAGRLTPADQDHVVDVCVQCTLCHANCPYTPEAHEWNVDFPRLMLRARAMQHANGITSMRHGATSRLLGRTDLIGSLGSATAPVANRIVGARPGSATRKVLQKVTGVSSVRLLAPYAKQRFSTWFAKRPTVGFADRNGRVTVFPTCHVEYHDTAIGQDLVKVYERNGIGCGVTAAGCCGTPWLHAGRIAEFAKIAQKNVATLADEVRAGTDIVVPQPACSSVIKNDYPVHVSGPDAQLVASRTFDAAAYLMDIHARTDTSLDTDFRGDTPSAITYHAPCHLRSQDIGLPGRDLMTLTGATVTVVRQCSGGDGRWALRAGNEDVAVPMADILGEQVVAAGGDVVVGDCSLSNTAIVEVTGLEVRHPLQVMARAYGIAEE